MCMMDSYFWRMSPFKRLVWLKFFSGGGSSSILKTVTGTLLHITDALAKPAKKFVATLEPIQDLHGQDAPYPAGGGKNKYPIAVGDDVWVNNGSATHSKTSDGSLVIVTSSENAYSGVYLNTETAIMTSVLSSFGSDARTISMDIVASASGDVRLTSGNTATFTVGTTKQRISIVSTNTGCSIYGVNNGATLTISNVQIESGSTATSWSPYSNECPITGHTGASVYDTGKNLLDISVWTTGELNVNNGTVTPNSNKSVSPYIFLKSGTYTVSRLARSTGNWIKACLYDSEKVFANYLFNNTNLTNTFTLNSNGYIRIGTDYVAEESDHIQLELSSTATTYEEYKGTTIPITFPDAAGTVYGAKLINEGTETWKLRVDRAISVFNGTESWSLQRINSYNIANFELTPKLQNYAAGKVSAGISNTFKPQTTTAANTTESGFYITSQGYLFFRVDGAVISTIADFTTWLASNNVQLVYELATPIEYTLTESQALTLLSGINNVWCENSDSLELQYYAKAEETTP